MGVFRVARGWANRLTNCGCTGCTGCKKKLLRTIRGAAQTACPVPDAGNAELLWHLLACHGADEIRDPRNRRESAQTTARRLVRGSQMSRVRRICGPARRRLRDRSLPTQRRNRKRSRPMNRCQRWRPSRSSLVARVLGPPALPLPSRALRRSWVRSCRRALRQPASRAFRCSLWVCPRPSCSACCLS